MQKAFEYFSGVLYFPLQGYRQRQKLQTFFHFPTIFSILIFKNRTNICHFSPETAGTFLHTLYLFVGFLKKGKLNALSFFQKPSQTLQMFITLCRTHFLIHSLWKPA